MSAVLSCPTLELDPEWVAVAESFPIERAALPRKIVVAMSGGVDSAVAAWLLKEAGHEVIGVSLRLAPDDGGSLSERKGRCCSVDDMTDARQVCDRLGIPFYAIDARERFKKTVFEPFAKAYQAGQTPIPCLACNHEVKFGDLYKTAQSLGAGLATGHYARLVDYGEHRTFARPTDAARDQTYYLYGTRPEVVKSLELPLGDMPKPLARALAHRAGLRVSKKPDSQEICFVPDGNHAKVVENQLGVLPKGEMKNEAGKVVAQHDGVHHFTVGQRRGIGVGLGERAYVVDLDPATHLVQLGSKKSLQCQRVKAHDLRLLVPTNAWPTRVSVQIRARSSAQLAEWTLLESGEMVFFFDEPVSAVALGQAAVCYDGDVLLGGGIICARMDGAFPRSCTEA